MHKLAIYDMDKTITHAPTWTAFLLSTARDRTPWRLALLPFAGFAMLGYGVGLLDRGRLKQVTQRLLLGGAVPPEAISTAARTFADKVLKDGIFGAARRRIATDRAQGYRIVMATASYRFYARSIGDGLGFDDVIGTEAVTLPDGRVTARIAGENCYGPAKLRMIEAWMARQGIARPDAMVRFYSDHVSDAPALAWADEAFAVNAHGPLRTLARERGWRVLDWER